MTLDLMAFLRARFDEDAVGATLRTWHNSECDAIPNASSEYTYPCDCGVPERVLAEVDAKRRTLTLHSGVILRGGAGAKYYDTTTVCRSCAPPQFAENAWPCPTLRLLTLPYRDHPEYQPDWAPGS